MERRKFIKSGCSYCAALASAGVLGTLIEGCKPSELIYRTEAVSGLLRIPAEKFLEKKYLIIRVQQLEYDLLVVKDTGAAYHTLAMQCTHQRQPLVVTSTGLVCNEHGSRFDLDGNVKKDPATLPLQRFKTEFENPDVVIYLS